MLLFDVFEVELLLIIIIRFSDNNFIYSMYYVCVQYKYIFVQYHVHTNAVKAYILCICMYIIYIIFHIFSVFYKLTERCRILRNGARHNNCYNNHWRADFLGGHLIL